MRVVEFGPTSDVRTLTEMFQKAGAIAEPSQMLQHFGRWFGTRRPSDLFMSVSRRNMPPGKFKVTRWLTQADRADPDRPAPNPWRDWAKIPEHSGGVVGEILAQGVPTLATGLDTSRDELFGPFAGKIRSAMAIPTYDGAEALNWAIWFYESAEPPPESFFVETIMQTNLLGMATKNLVSRRQIESLNAELTRQFEQVAVIQQSLLPQKLPSIPGFVLATSYLTSTHAGGDYYDFFRFPSGRWGVLIADVAGHGAGAATVMAMLRAILHCYDACHDDEMRLLPGEVMAFANRKLVESRLAESFVTAFFALLDPATGELAFTRCGHNPPRIKRDGSPSIVTLEEPGGLPLGIADEIPLETGQARLGPGDTLVLYTDGIVEAFGPRGADGTREMFGVRRLDEALAGCSGEPECVVDSVHAALFAHTGVMERDDDQTLVVLRRGHA